MAHSSLSGYVDSADGAEGRVAIGERTDRNGRRWRAPEGEHPRVVDLGDPVDALSTSSGSASLTQEERFERVDPPDGAFNVVIDRTDHV